MRIRQGPPPTRVEEFVEEYHGQAVVDPYRWLEDGKSPETTAWVEAQNAHTRALLDAVPCREQVKQRLTELLAIGMVGTPVPRGDRYFYRRREGTENQPILYVRDGLHGKDRVAFDPNEESAEGLATLDWWFPSPDGKLLAYGVSWHGDEWSTGYVLDVDTGNRLEDHLERMFLASMAWLPDGSGFYYTRNPLPGEVPPEEEKYHRKVFFHRLGNERAADREIFGSTLNKTDRPAVSVSPDGRWLIVRVVRDWARQDLYLQDRSMPDGAFVPVAVGYDAHFNAQIVEETLYIHTNLDAPRYRYVRADPEYPDNWTTIIPERKDRLLVQVTPAGGKLVAAYLHDAVAALALYSSEGKHIRDLPVPGIGTVALWQPDQGQGVGVDGQWDRPEAFFTFQSFTVPPTVYVLNTQTAETAVWAGVNTPVRPDDFEVTQEWYSSRDGTRIPIFIVYRGDLDRSRPHPTVMTGYGGFGYSYLPALQRPVLDWLAHGGIFALPSLRGGGEFGAAWHRAGQRERKQNVFDDFIAAADYLIARGYTAPAKLGIMGLSNGGLLVGAALTQRPELFRAAVAGVGGLDMLRLLRLPPGQVWIPEYGDPDDPEGFRYLIAYSPYHNVRDGTPYPAVLLTTGEFDNRVNPLHTRKMGARLQAATASEHPILVRVERQAGHGMGTPLNKQIEEQIDIWTFLRWQLGLDCDS